MSNSLQCFSRPVPLNTPFLTLPAPKVLLDKSHFIVGRRRRDVYTICWWLNFKYPGVISNKNQHKRCKGEPLSVKVGYCRWRMLIAWGLVHVLKGPGISAGFSSLTFAISTQLSLHLSFAWDVPQCAWGIHRRLSNYHKLVSIHDVCLVFDRSSTLYETLAKFAVALVFVVDIFRAGFDSSDNDHGLCHDEKFSRMNVATNVNTLQDDLSSGILNVRNYLSQPALTLSSEHLTTNINNHLFIMSHRNYKNLQHFLLSKLYHRTPTLNCVWVDIV